jgi:hypothetical protein
MTERPFVEARHRLWLQAFYDLELAFSPRQPTVREYARTSRLTSTSTAYYRIGVLKRLGLLESPGVPKEVSALRLRISNKGLQVLE